MYCLNCGTHLEDNPEFCSCCNILVRSHGTMAEKELVAQSNFGINTGTGIDNHCPNCLEPLETKVSEKCHSCNYQIIPANKKVRSAPKSDNGYLKFERSEMKFDGNFGFN